MLFRSNLRLVFPPKPVLYLLNSLLPLTSPPATFLQGQALEYVPVRVCVPASHRLQTQNGPYTYDSVNSLLSNDSTLPKLTGMFQANLPCLLLTSCSTAAWMLGLVFLSCSTLEKSLRNQSSPPQSVPDYQFHVRATEASHCDGRPSDHMPSVLDAVTSFDKHVQLSIHSLWRWRTGILTHDNGESSLTSCGK